MTPDDPCPLHPERTPTDQTRADMVRALIDQETQA